MSTAMTYGTPPKYGIVVSAQNHVLISKFDVHLEHIILNFELSMHDMLSVLWMSIDRLYVLYTLYQHIASILK